MKKILFIGFLLLTTKAFSQDVLTKKNGDELLVKVLEISNTDIKYKKWSNQDGPSYILSKSEVFMIKYKNGDKDVFADQAPIVKAETATVSGGIARASSRNKEIIDSYNNNGAIFNVAKTKNKKAYGWVGILGVDTTSIMSSSSLEIEIVQRKGCLLNGTYMNPWPFNGHYYLQLYNKTNNTIYVDLGNTFRVDEKGNYKVYFNTTQTTINHGSGGSVGLNIGAVSNVLGINGAIGTLANGINVSKGNHNSSSKTYSQQRVIAIPPHGVNILEQCEWEHVGGVALWKEENNIYKSYCEGFNYSYDGITINQGQLIHYSFNDSPRKYRYTITYSKSENFLNWEALTLKVYVKEMLGGHKVYFFNRKKGLINDSKRTIIVGGK